MPARSTVGVVFGGRSAEHQVSIRSARTVAGALREAGHRVFPLGVTLDGAWVDRETSQGALSGTSSTLEAVGGDIRPSLDRLLAAPIDLAFPLIHGTWGEDGTLQGLFEMLDLPYVGAGVGASALAMDKVQCKRVLEAVGLATVDFRALGRAAWERDRAACLATVQELPGPPLFVKPAVGGSSVGVRRVGAAAELEGAIDFAFRFDEQVLVERAVAGRELECAVLGYRELEASVVGEIIPGHEFYDYADKYIDDGARLEAPARLDVALAGRLRQMAVEAFAAIGGVGMARVDFLLEGEAGLFVNEINTLPGFTSISMYPRLWELAGVPLPDLVARLVEIADRRHADRRLLNDGIRQWIEEL
jgi:D-alanine-D-alanine ligase